MLYFLYEHFHINIFRYISVRAIIAFFTAFILTLWFLPLFIKWAKQKTTQPIYNLAPENHKTKSKTPSMGGVIFILSAFIASLLSVKFNFYVGIVFLAMLGFMIIGMIDDLGKILNKNNQAGLSAKAKFLLQTLLAFFISLILYFHHFDTYFYIPFYKHPLFDMGFFAVFFWTFVIVGMSNAVNLTDGLDGLATIPSIFSFFTLSLFLYILGNAIFSRYLFFPFELGVGEVVIISTATTGALLGFLWYNANPADVFMGDSGSLTLGALIGVLAILAKSEILLFFIGFVFIIETISVILQVGSYKTTGKRIFKMAPIHHHFEQIGWKENKITVRFWIIAFITNLIAILSIKIR